MPARERRVLVADNCHTPGDRDLALSEHIGAGQRHLVAVEHDGRGGFGHAQHLGGRPGRPGCPVAGILLDADQTQFLAQLHEGAVALHGVQELGGSGHAGDPAVPEGGQVLDDQPGGLRVVDIDRRQGTVVTGAAHHQRRLCQLFQRGDAGVVRLQVHQDDTVHPALSEPASVGVDLGLRGVHDLHLEGVVRCAQHLLETGHEGTEERLGAEHLGRAGQHHAHRLHGGAGQGPSGVGRFPLELAGDTEDAFPGRIGHTGSTVDRE